MVVRKSKGFEGQGIEKSYLNVGRESNKHFVGRDVMMRPEGRDGRARPPILGGGGETVM